MKIGDLVTVKNGKQSLTGIIVYKKDNNNIGVNFSHYSFLLDGVKKGKMTYPQMLKCLKLLGSDHVFTKEQLNPGDNDTSN